MVRVILLFIFILVSMNATGQLGVSVQNEIDVRNQLIRDPYIEREIRFFYRPGISVWYNITPRLKGGINYCFTRGLIHPKIIAYKPSFNHKSYHSAGPYLTFDIKKIRNGALFLRGAYLIAINYPVQLETYEKNTKTLGNLQYGGGAYVNIGSHSTLSLYITLGHFRDGRSNTDQQIILGTSLSFDITGR